MSAEQQNLKRHASAQPEQRDNGSLLPTGPAVRDIQSLGEPTVVSSTPTVTAGPPQEKARPVKNGDAEQFAEYAFLPAFVTMLVIAGAERYLTACLLTKAANKGSWLAIEAYVFLFDRQPTFLSILLGFDIQEFHPIVSPLTFLRAILQLAHFGLHWLLAYVCFRWCYRLSRLAGHTACAVAAILMVALWFVVLPALGAHLPGPRKAEKVPPRNVSRPFD